MQSNSINTLEQAGSVWVRRFTEKIIRNLWSGMNTVDTVKEEIQSDYFLRVYASRDKLLFADRPKQRNII